MKPNLAKTVLLVFAAAAMVLVISRQQPSVCLAPDCSTIVSASASASAGPGGPGSEPDTVALRELALERGRLAASRTFGLLSSNLLRAIRTSGITNALPYCSVMADPLTRQVAQELHADIRRVTHKPRNVTNLASAQELELISRYQAMLVAGTNLLSPTVVTPAADTVIFYAPIVITNSLCLQCHGAPGTDVLPDTLVAIQRLYPRDQATGFRTGDVRGLWRVEFSRAQLAPTP